MTVTGGKLTTYRKMAQDTVDAVVRQLGESPRRRRCVTKPLPLLGATTKTRDPVAMAQPHARLLGRYGTESAEVLALADGQPRAARAGHRRPALHRRRGALRRPRGDGPDPRRRAGPPDPGHDPAGAAHHGRRRGGGHTHRPRHGLGRTAEAAEQAARFTESCQKELLTAGLDLP